MKDRDRRVEHADEVHVMIHDDHSGGAVHFLDDRNKPIDLRTRYTRGRLVEEHKPRLVGEHEADLHELSLAMRELAHIVARNRFQGELGYHFIGCGPGALLAMATTRREPEVFQNGEAVHDGGDLRLDADAEAHNLVGRPPRNVLAPDKNPAARLATPDLTDHGFEEGALA